MVHLIRYSLTNLIINLRKLCFLGGVCLYLCLQNNSKNILRISMKFSENYHLFIYSEVSGLGGGMCSSSAPLLIIEMVISIF